MMLESKKSTNSTLSALWNGKSQNTYISQVKASSVVVECDDIEFFDWSLHNSCAYFWSCDDIGKCPMLKVAIQRAIEKSPHYDLTGNPFQCGSWNIQTSVCWICFILHLVQCLDVVSSTQLCHILHRFRLQYCCNLLIDYTSYSFQHTGSSYMLLQLMQFWKNESLSLKLTNTIIGCDVKVNQDSIHGYMGLRFDMSNFNEDGSHEVYTFWHKHANPHGPVL
jgi:hypothetical protein